MKRIAAVTVARSDWGLLLPVLRGIRKSRSLDLRLLVGGTHFAVERGDTLGEIVDDGFAPDVRVDTLPASDSPEAVAEAVGSATAAFARALAAEKPDLLLVLGDRYEMHAAALAALPQRIPVAHIHGGELSEGAIDDALRHSLTKLSHLHFASTHEHARRIVQLGEEPWRVRVTGAPGIDTLVETEPSSPAELDRRFGIDLSQPTVLLTFHAATLAADPAGEIEAVLEALRRTPYAVVATYPGADTGGDVIATRLRDAASAGEVVLVPHLGRAAYCALLRQAVAMVGNSSSGIVEAATFALPVINVGDRQRGRTRARNVIDVRADSAAITEALGRAADPQTRTALSGLENPYGDGRAAPRIVSALEDETDAQRLLDKHFHDVDVRA